MPAELLSCTYCIDPVLYGWQDSVISAVVYLGGCLAEDMITLRVDENAVIYIPNVFTPDGDGINDHVTVFADPRVRRVVHLRSLTGGVTRYLLGRIFRQTIRF
jgi:hypothetical protein